jgi:hypothetical protein
VQTISDNALMFKLQCPPQRLPGRHRRKKLIKKVLGLNLGPFAKGAVVRCSLAMLSRSWYGNDLPRLAFLAPR